MPRLLIDLVLAIIAALLWVAADFAQSNRIFGGGGLPAVLHIAAALATAALFVAVGSRIVLRLGFARLLNTEPTELQRGLVAAALSFAAIAMVLAHFGFDFSSILVFSALITAVVGLSIQPLLGSLVSGMAAERVIGVGDGVRLDGEAVEVQALRWRSVIGRRSDGSQIVLPNARLIENTMEILGRGQPVRAESRFDIPSSAPPHRVQTIVADLLVDFPEVDRSRPVRLMPMNIERMQGYQFSAVDGHASVRYRVTFWVRHFSQRAEAETRLLRRLWYGLRREGLVAPGDEMRLAGPAVTAALQRLENQAALGFANLAAADVLIGAGRPLLYDDGERIALPADLAEHLCLLVDGGLADDPGHAASAGHGLTREASLARIKHLLADHIGPYATYAVDQAARHDASLAEICAAAAEEIDDEGQRAAFLAAANVPVEQGWGPGLLFRTKLEAGRIVSQRRLRVVGHALLLVAPDWAFRNEPEHAPA